MDLADRLARFDESDLYVVITEAFCAGRSADDVLARVLDAGVRLVQLREKGPGGRELYHRAERFRRATESADALLIINDRLDVALAVDADGVHLGLDDLPVAAARAAAPQLIVGASSHDLDEALRADRDGASYVNVGPVFPTSTKSVPTGAIGPEMLDLVTPKLNARWTVMGGIKIENVDQVVSRGARHVAVVTAVTAADDVVSSARILREKIRAGRA